MCASRNAAKHLEESRNDSNRDTKFNALAIIEICNTSNYPKYEEALSQANATPK